MTARQRRDSRRVVVGEQTSSDRERMADHLHRLHLFATANAVRSGSATLADGVAHVRDYCLPKAEANLVERVQTDAADPPKPGTWGAGAAKGIRTRRDELQAFLDEWFAYDLTPVAEAAKAGNPCAKELLAREGRP